MEAISFVLGILFIVGMIMVILAIYSFVKINALNAKVTELETVTNTSIDSLIRQLDIYTELDNRRIDGEIERTDSMIKELNRYIDSRVDKMESRLLLEIESTIISDKTVK